MGLFVLESSAGLLRTDQLFCVLRVGCCVGTLFLQNYVCSQKLASDIIHVAANGELADKLQEHSSAATPGKERTAAFFCFRGISSFCRSKQSALNTFQKNESFSSQIMCHAGISWVILTPCCFKPQ
jgi:hypothetical protein